MNNIKEIIVSLKTRVALAELIGPDEMIVSASDLSALIAQLEAAQKERDAFKQQITSLFERVSGESVIDYPDDAINWMADMIEGELDANSSALSAANEKLKGERVPVGWEVCSPEWCNKHNACHEAPRIWFASEDGTGPHYHPSDFTATQKPVVFHPANDIANIGDNRHLWHQRDLMWQSAIKAAGFTVKEDATPPSLSSLRPLE